MNTIQVYDPAMCCSTGICGTSIDPDLANLAAMLNQMKMHGIKVERFNLGQQPMAFATNPAVKQLLEAEGVESLPLIFINGELKSKGHYPTREERGELLRSAVSPA